MRRALPIFIVTATALAQQSAFDPAGPAARRIERLGAEFLILLAVIFLIVLAVALVPLARRHRGIHQEPLEQHYRPSESTERRLGWSVGMASALTVLILFALVVVSVSASRAVSSQRPANGLVIEVTGNQWWWQVRYSNDDPTRIVTTANELHIPINRPVMIRGTSNDVIHSFWVPGLQGKRDLIPGHVTTEWMEADQPGRFRGQCAEFCGLQHAHMALWVVAEPEDQFDSWINHQLEPAAAPSDPITQRGQVVFLNSACVLCHAIQGTPAVGQAGPDLTHFGSRLTIAAGTLPNNKGNLAGWIADPQTIKPGTHMATVPVQGQDMQPLLEYLENLQ